MNRRTKATPYWRYEHLWMVSQETVSMAHCKYVLIGLFLISLVACSSLPSSSVRTQYANQIASNKNWHSIVIKSDEFDLQAFVPQNINADQKLTVYIEGDGLAWVTATTPSKDPTPLNPIALHLAIAQPSGLTAYLARPCQYIGSTQSDCNQRYWTTSRFSIKVMQSMNQGIDTLKVMADANELILVGYSGGATIAAWLAAYRTDVIGLITVAGNLDHTAWTQHHRITPLTGSVSPESYRNQLRDIKQLHFAGGKDVIIPPFLVSNFARSISKNTENTESNVIIEHDFDHSCCWVEHWPRLYNSRVKKNLN